MEWQDIYNITPFPYKILKHQQNDKVRDFFFLEKVRKILISLNSDMKKPSSFQLISL